MKYKIAFIIPYFGLFPNTFQLWLNSCSWNPEFDWLIFTDDRKAYNYFPNVKVHYMSFTDLKSLIQKNYDFPISLNHPYKLCDFRPAYGEIFTEYLIGYDFWGYCDIDLFWGDLGKWINDESLKNIDRVSEWGHCCLFRNDSYINTLYRQHVDNTVSFRSVFSSDCNYLYDEVGGLQKMFVKNNVPTLHIPFYDVRSDSKRFKTTCASEQYVIDKAKNTIFKIGKGAASYCCIHNNQIYRQEVSYIHFAKRTLLQEVDNSSCNFFIIPNKIIAQFELTPIGLSRMQPRCNWYIEYEWKELKGKIDILLGNNKVKWPGSRLQKISDFIHKK